MSFLFHSPTQAPLPLPVTQTREERVGGRSCIHCSLAVYVAWGKTISGGMFSPRVRVSLAMRLRRVSATDGGGATSENVGDMGVAAGIGDRGTRVSVGAIGTALMRRTSGGGVIAERCALLVVFGVGTTSMVVRDSMDVRETREEFDEEVEYMEAFEEAVSGNNVKIDPCRREAFVRDL